MGTKANDPALERIPDDEPIFVLRAQDLLAPVVVKLWAEMAFLHGLPLRKYQEVRGLALEMETWPHPRKFPD